MKRESALHVVAPAPAPKKKKPVRVGLMHPDFKYKPSGETDIRKTFARIRREMAKGTK